MKPPLISCIVPVFNGERYLEEALESILAQTYRPLQIIIADDGSTDGTAAVTASYGQEIIVLRQPTAGPAAARNLGLHEAQGSLVAFLDQDDVWHPEKLARQVARFQARPTLDVCVTHVRMFWISELREEAARHRHHRRAQAVPGYTTGTLLARRRLFDTVGQFNPSLWFSDASDWFLRAGERGAVMELLPNVLLYHRMHHNNLTRRQAAASRDEYVGIVKASLDRRRRSNRTAPVSYEFPASGWQEKA
jgi:glycosyltransferase involved in cell wall biosynthesis